MFEVVIVDVDVEVFALEETKSQIWGCLAYIG